jgi:outer membrane protein TolC
VRIALQSSPRLAAARHGAEAGLAQAERERPVARPVVTTEAVGTLQGPRVTFPRPNGTDATVLPERYGRLQLTVEQTLFRAGLGAARDRYSALTGAARWEVVKAEADLALEVREAYYQLGSARAMRAAADEGLALSQRQLDLSRVLFQSGNVPERDIRAAEADVAEAEQGALAAENGAALALANLNRLLGRDLAEPVTVPVEEAPPLAPDGPAEAVERGLRFRPEVRLLEENLRAARAGVSLAGSQNQPTLSGRAAAARQTETALTDRNYLAGSLVLTWQPFDQGRTRADVAEARARAAQLEALLRDARAGIRLEVERAWRDMRDGRAGLEAARRQAAAAESALEISRIRYEAGAAPQMEVSGAMLKAVQARGAAARAEFDLRAAAARFRHASAADAPATPEPPGRPRP